MNLKILASTYFLRKMSGHHRSCFCCCRRRRFPPTSVPECLNRRTAHALSHVTDVRGSRIATKKAE